MTIDRSWVSQELANVRAQQQQAAAVVQQTIGAEKALLAILARFDQADGEMSVASEALDPSGIEIEPSDIIVEEPLEGFPEPEGDFSAKEH